MTPPSGGLLDVPASMDWACPSPSTLDHAVGQIRPIRVSGNRRDSTEWLWPGGHKPLRLERSQYLSPPGWEEPGAPDEVAWAAIDRLIQSIRGNLLWAVAAYWRGGPERTHAEDPFSVWILSVLLVRRAGGLAHARNDLLAPYYDRALFLLLSQPFRRSGHDLAAQIRRDTGGDVALSRLAFEARRARWVWARHLDGLGDHPTFESLTTREIDVEIDLLALDSPGEEPDLLELHTNRPQQDPRSMPNRGSTQETSDAERGFVKWHARRLLLPRFRLLDSYRILRRLPRATPNGQRGGGRSESVARRRILAAVPDAPIIAMIWMATLCVWSAIGLVAEIESPLSVMPAGPGSIWWWLVIVVAGLPYIEVLVAIRLGAGPEVAYPLALRLPAVAVLGATIVMPLGTWWYASSHWRTVGLLVVFSLGYLVLEASNHRVSRPVRRAGFVLLLGLGHGFAVSVLWFALAGDIFLPPVECAASALDICDGTGSNLFIQPDEVLADRSLVLANLCLTASMGVVLGLTLQVLWDDRPVTYPLTHLGGS